MNSIDWSKAPKGAEFFAYGGFRKIVEGCKHPYVWTTVYWTDGGYTLAECKKHMDYEQRPKEWPEETRIDNIGRNRTEDDMGHYDNEREQHDPVNNPKHYAIAPSIEAIDIIKASLTPEQFKGYMLGNFLKYRLRAGDKGDLQQDIDKSNWYRERLNTLREAGK